MKLTLEQEKIINSDADIKINAVAGSGKTTTLIEYAKSRPKQSNILYLAFNKSVKIEAEYKFAKHELSNVKIETAHSLAFKHIIYNSHYKIKQGDYKPYELVTLLELNGLNANHEMYIIANHILKMAALFCNSVAKKVTEIDYIKTISDSKAKSFVKINFQYIEKWTRHFLAKMDKGEIDITHDFYLKKFQLSNPQLHYNYILFDEGQDASPAMLHIFLKQTATKVIVGDTHQQIYSWRYAINSLEQVAFKSFNLNTSFRFGNKIAQLANEILQLKTTIGSQLDTQVHGKGSATEKLTKAIIARTNLGLLIHAINYVTDNRKIKKIYFEGNFNSYTYADEGASLYDVLNLYNKKYHLIRDELLANMHSIEELKDYIEKTDDKQLQMMLDIVMEYENELPSLIKSLKDKHVGDSFRHQAEVIFSTVHRCKGMEYDVVELANDFITEEKIYRQKNQPEFESQKERIIEEINLLYVAITRAKSLLRIPEELVPDNFICDVTIERLKKPEPQKKADMVIPNYSARTKSNSFENPKINYMSLAKEKNVAAYQPWTEKLDKELAKQFESGKTYAEMALHFNRTKGAIISRLKKIGIY